jgi:type I restriction enzyme, R subunit
MSQFAFLQAEFPDLFDYAQRAENLAHADPRCAAFYCRLALETAVARLYRHDRALKDPYETTLAARRGSPSRALPRSLAARSR